MIKKLIYGILAILSFCLVSISDAAPTIDKKMSMGVALSKRYTGTKLIAFIIVDYGDDSWAEDCDVSVTIPYMDKSVPLVLDEREDVGKGRSFFSTVVPLLEEEMKDSNLTGNYVFTLSDKQGNILDTYSDFFVPYRDEAFHGMGDFNKDQILPKNGDIVKQKDLVFQWNNVKGAVVYQVKIYKGKGRTYDPYSSVYKATTKENQLRITDIKLDPGKYWWRLQAFHEDGPKQKNIVRFTLDEDDRYPTFTIE